MKHRWLITAVLSLAAAAGVVAGPSAAGKSGQKQVTANELLKARNGARRLTLTVGRSSDTMTLHLRVQLTRGMIQWRLLDPSGTARDGGEVVPGPELDEVRDLRPAEGCWVLEINWLGATGSQSVDWRVN